jgi:predicted nucleic acid-binding Zn ribbon protein
MLCIMAPTAGVKHGQEICQEQDDQIMSKEPDRVRNNMRVCSGPACAALLLSGAAVVVHADDTPDSSAWPADDSGRGYYGYSDYGVPGYLDPGYAATLGTINTGPLYGIGGYGLYGHGWGGYGYPGYGLSGYGYPGYGYGIGAYDNYASRYGESAASRAVDQRYIRQLEERIRKLEKASREPRPFYGARASQWTLSTYPGNQPSFGAPEGGYAGQSSGNPWSRSWQDSQGEYPTYQPSYGSPPAYRFRQ